MKEIKLTQGKVTLVDDEDFEYLKNLKWCFSKAGNTFYARHGYNVHKGGKSIRNFFYMHRMIMGNPDGMEIDHLNHDGLNNCKSNLRICTHRENLMNNNNNRFIGVGYKKNRTKFEARIRINGKLSHLGNYPTPEEAHAVYMKAAKELIKKEYEAINML